MSWFKKLFQGNKPKSEVKIEAKEEEVLEFTSRTSSKAYFSGLDYDFIDFIYFKDEIEKEKFIENIEKLLNKLQINEQMDAVSGRRIAVDYNSDAEEPIPFLINIILYNSLTATTVLQWQGKEVTESSKRTTLDTQNRLDNYYDALSLCSFNLKKKVENGIYDFQFEEELINKTLEKSDLFNFARVSTLFILGDSLYKAGQIESMESTFDRIRKENYTLSPPTVAGYYRKIGEIYIDLQQTDKALNWLKAGLTLNPKLGVKKLIDKLEKNQ